MKLSVILTSYNHEKFLEESIQSVLNQTYRNFEFIIVDDCSKDSSWDIICRYKEMYPEIVTVRHEYNWGGGTVEDTVKQYVTGDYVALHHSDDVWECDKLQKQVDVLRNNPECVAVFTNAQAIDEDGHAYADENGFYFDLFKVENRNRYEWLNYFFYHGNCLCHPSILIKKSVYEEDGFFRKGLRQVPDFVKWIQICKRHDIYVLPDKLVKFRVRNAGKNTSGMRADTQIRSTVELFLMLQEYVSIYDKDEFIKIFPEAKKYCDKDYFSSQYVLGRLCTEEGMPPYTRLFGVMILYAVLNKPEHAEAIEEQYQYTKKTFALENGKVDIFGILPKAFEQTRTIYINTGKGFNLDQCVVEQYTLNANSEFEMRSKISLNDEQELLELRFDPAERIMSCVELKEVRINGIAIKCSAENAVYQSGGKDYFINLDPIYRLEVPEELRYVKVIEVLLVGRIERLDDDIISDIVTKVMYLNRDEVYVYQGKVAEQNHLVEHCQRLVADFEECIQEYQLIIQNEKMQYQQCNQLLEREREKYLECQVQLEQEKEAHDVCKIRLQAEMEEKHICQEQLVATRNELQNCSEQIDLLMKENEVQKQELDNIKNTRWYKLLTKISK